MGDANCSMLLFFPAPAATILDTHPVRGRAACWQHRRSIVALGSDGQCPGASAASQAAAAIERIFPSADRCGLIQCNLHGNLASQSMCYGWLELPSIWPAVSKSIPSPVQQRLHPCTRHSTWHCLAASSTSLPGLPVLGVVLLSLLLVMCRLVAILGLTAAALLAVVAVVVVRHFYNRGIALPFRRKPQALDAEPDASRDESETIELMNQDGHYSSSSAAVVGQEGGGDVALSLTVPVPHHAARTTHAGP